MERRAAKTILRLVLAIKAVTVALEPRSNKVATVPAKAIKVTAMRASELISNKVATVPIKTTKVMVMTASAPRSNKVDMAVIKVMTTLAVMDLMALQCNHKVAMVAVIMEAMVASR